jgi:outer membrane protein
MRSFDKGVHGRPLTIAVAIAAASWAFTGRADAQEPAAPPPMPPTPPGSAPAAPAALPDVANAATGPDLTAAVPGGITAEQVASRAAATSYQAKAAEASHTGASARAEQAWTNFLPRIGLTARYTRLSDFTPPSLGGSGGGSLVGTAATPTNPPTPLPAGTLLFPTALNFSFPLVLDNYLTQATIAIPISDYFLRVNQSYTAATNAEEAARWDIVTQRAKSYSDGKIAYFTWLRARGAVVVATQSLVVAQAHLKDAQNQFAVGNASRADVLRAETQVAAAELQVERARTGVVLTERQIRVAIHAKDEEKLEPGDPLDTTLTAAPTNLRAMITEAQANRPEIKSIDKNAEAARKLSTASKNGAYPSLSGFGDVTYANPNQRRFPQKEEWFPTWAVGAQITWSPNDLIASSPAAADAEARAATLDAQKGAIRDGVELEVTQAFQAVVEADTALATTRRQLDSALEGYRVARELFNAGRGTSTTLIDAENALAASRFDQLNARVDARLARIRLEHALGRDVKAP